MEQWIILLGFAFVMIGIVLLIFGAIGGGSNVKTKVAFGGFIGPVPFGFASEPKMFKFLIAFMIIALAVFILIPFVLRGLAK